MPPSQPILFSFTILTHPQSKQSIAPELPLLASQPPPTNKLLHNVRSRKGRKGSGQGWSQATPKGTTRQHPGYYQARDPTIGTTRWCQVSLL
jgi:hypothetical protein